MFIFFSDVAPVDTSQILGGDGGTPFDDISSSQNRNITAIRLTCGDTVVTIQVRYGDEWGLEHGVGFASKYCHWEGQLVEHTLAPTEYVHTIKATYGRFLNSITLETNVRTLPSCGNAAGSVKTASGTRLMYISGRKGCIIDAIQPHWALD